MFDDCCAQWLSSMTVREQTEFLVVGHFAHDTVVSDAGETHHTLGGPPAYISSILEPLVADYSVIAKVGRDFRYLRNVHKAPIVISDCSTTAFVNDYSHSERRQVLEAVCEPIFPEDVNGAAKIGLACGMFNEILPETLLRLREVCEILVGDVQGFLRVRREDDSVGHMNLADTVYTDFLEHFDYLTMSTYEAEFVQLETLRNRMQVLVTQGEHGCTVYDKNGSFSVPGLDVSVKDTTGAGDCFIAGFAYGLAKGLDHHGAAEFANYCGALAVQHIGIPKLEKEDFKSILEKLSLTV